MDTFSVELQHTLPYNPLLTSHSYQALHIGLTIFSSRTTSDLIAILHHHINQPVIKVHGLPHLLSHGKTWLLIQLRSMFFPFLWPRSPYVIG